MIYLFFLLQHSMLLLSHTILELYLLNQEITWMLYKLTTGSRSKGLEKQHIVPRSLENPEKT